MELWIILALLILLLGGWAVSTQRRLSILAENADSAMRQLGVQLSSRLDALAGLLELAAGCAPQEVQPLSDRVRAQRSGGSTAITLEDVQRQEQLIDETLHSVTALTQAYPQLEHDARYKKCTMALDCYEKMVQTSVLIYNDAVAKLNRAVMAFPARLAAGAMGFRQRAYLELPKA